MIQLLHYTHLHNQTWCAAATFWRYGTSAIGPTGNRLCTRPSCTNMYAIPNIVIPKPCTNDQFLIQSHNLINKWMHGKRGTPIMGDTFQGKGFTAPKQRPGTKPLLKNPYARSAMAGKALMIAKTSFSSNGPSLGLWCDCKSVHIEQN